VARADDRCRTRRHTEATTPRSDCVARKEYRRRQHRPRATRVRGSSRAIAVVATRVFLPLAELKRTHSRTCAFQAMLRMLRGRSLSRSRKVSPPVVTGRAFRQNEAEKSRQLLRGCKAPYICQPPHQRRPRQGKTHPAWLARLPSPAPFSGSAQSHAVAGSKLPRERSAAPDD
jgi:hypothetical protein